MPNAAAELYDHDFLLWTREQSKLLREAAERRVNFPLDWENLAEEIESLGKSLRSELRSRLRTIIEHLLKLEHSAAANRETAGSKPSNEREARRNCCLKKTRASAGSLPILSTRCSSGLPKSR